MRLPRFRLARLSTIVAAGVIALSALIGPAMVPAQFGGRVAQAFDVDFDFFRQALSPYGQWFNHDRYGQVWRPSGVHQGWRPYYDDGRWAYSDEYGWMWVSDQPWGWAPFHYGRWAYSPDSDWFWVPGSEWGPAWVTFRSGEDMIGWAPLPPEADWDPGYGFRGDDYYYDRHYDNYYDNYGSRYGNRYGSRYGNNFGLLDIIWTFVRPEGFLEPRFDRYVYDRGNYRSLMPRTRNVTYITVVDRRVVNRSFEIDRIERATRKKVRRVNVEETDRPDRVRKNGRSVVIFKPVVVDRDKRRATSRRDDNAGEQPTGEKRRRSGEADNARSRQQQVAPDEPSARVDRDVEQPVKRKPRSNARAGSDDRRREVNRVESDDEPVKRKKRSNAAVQRDDRQPEVNRAESDDEPVKRKKRSNAAVQRDDRGQQLERIEPSAGDSGSARKKRTRDRDDAQVRKAPRQQQEQDQPRKKRKSKKCKGDGCPE